MTPPKPKSFSSVAPLVGPGPAATPGPAAPQLMTVAMLSAAQDGCDCDACKALRKMVNVMKEEVLNDA